MKTKTFDCVKMKHEIQQRILKEMKGMSHEEEMNYREQQILSDPVLGPLWERLREKKEA